MNEKTEDPRCISCGKPILVRGTMCFRCERDRTGGRPRLEFAMDFLGDPEATELRAYIEELERAASPSSKSTKEVTEVLRELVEHFEFVPTDSYYRDETQAVLEKARALLASSSIKEDGGGGEHV